MSSSEMPSNQQRIYCTYSLTCLLPSNTICLYSSSVNARTYTNTYIQCKVALFYVVFLWATVYELFDIAKKKKKQQQYNHQTSRINQFVSGIELKMKRRKTKNTNNNNKNTPNEIYDIYRDEVNILARAYTNYILYND